MKNVSEEKQSSTATAIPARPGRRSPLIYARLGILACAAAMVTFVVILVIAGIRRGSMVPLTGERLDQAAQRWEKNVVDDYEIKIQVTGRQASRYHVEVTDAKPDRATRNGDPLLQRRTWWTWTVPGMFETLRADVRNMERYDAGEKGLPHLSVLVEFDEKYGFPRKYVRIESVKMGGNPEVTWEVTEFKPGL